MPERPDLRRIATDIREALGTYPPEALVDILTYVFQAYVVEGAPTVHAPPIERIADLEGMGFPDLIQTLQLRLDIPELSLFEVANGRVSVRVGGELVALLLGGEARRAATAPLPSSPAIQTAQSPAVSAPARGAPPGAMPFPAGGVPPAPPRPVTPAEAPRPTRGVSVNPGGDGPRPAPAATAAPAVRPATTPAVPSTEEPGEDDASSKRFSLLEID